MTVSSRDSTVARVAAVDDWVRLSEIRVVGDGDDHAGPVLVVVQLLGGGAGLEVRIRVEGATVNAA